MNETPDPVEQLITEWLTLEEAGGRLGVPPSKIRQMSKDLELLAVRTTSSKEWRVPALFLEGDALVKNIGGTVTLLHDSGFSEQESLVWLFTDDESLPGRPIDALRENRGREVRRRAQAMAF